MSHPSTSRKSDSFFNGIALFRPLAAFGIIFGHLVPEMHVDPGSALWSIRTLLHFGTPFFLLISFFLLTSSLLKSGGRRGSPWRSLSKRFRALYLPFLFWSAVYLGVHVAVAQLPGSGYGGPQMHEYLYGLKHLWFLQFVFLGSCLTVCLLPLLPSWEKHLNLYGTAFLVLGLALLVGEPWKGVVTGRMRFICAWLPLIPLGIALAFFHASHRSWLTWGRVGPLALSLIAGGLVLGLQSNAPAWYIVPRLLYGLGMVLLALLPWPAVLADRARPMAACSFGIYLVHMLVIYLCRAGLGVMRAEELVVASVPLFLLTALFCLGVSHMLAVGLTRLFHRVGCPSLMPVIDTAPRHAPAAKPQPRESAEPRLAPGLASA